MVTPAGRLGRSASTAASAPATTSGVLAPGRRGTLMLTVAPRGPPTKDVRSSCPSTTSAMDPTGTTPPLGVVATGMARMSSSVFGRASPTTVITCWSWLTRPTAARPIASCSFAATPAASRCSDATASGSRITSSSRTSPPCTSTVPTPGTLPSAGRMTYSATSRSSRGSTAPATLKVTTGKEPVVIRCTTIWVSCGSSLRVWLTRASTRPRARHMSVPGANCREISVAPRMVRERMRCTPSTAVSSCSSGRVTWVRKTSGGEPPVRATTTMRGNSTSG